MYTATVYFRHQAFASYVHNVDTLNRRILLTGPSGSSRCMAAVVSAVAKDSSARLLTFDWEMVRGEEEENEDDNQTTDDIFDEFDFFEDFDRRCTNAGEVSAS